MVLGRTTFFIILLNIIILPFLFHKLIWLSRSKKVEGVMGFVGKEYSGQIVHVYGVIRFKAGKDTIWFNGNDNILYRPGEKVPVRYQVHHPADARIDIFSSIWGDTIVYGGIPTLILLIVFLHPQIIPYRSKVCLKGNKPFVWLVGL